MYKSPTFYVSVGLSFKLVLSLYKDYILVLRAIGVGTGGAAGGGRPPTKQLGGAEISFPPNFLQ